MKKKKIDKKRRKMILIGVGSVGAVAGAYALDDYDKTQKQLHDLSVLGGGVPTIVQIHDPACPKCRSLKLRTTKILEDLPEGAVHYRLADVTTDEGKALQEKYGAQTITLLMFDGKGEMQGVLQGVREPREIEQAIRRILPAA